MKRSKDNDAADIDSKLKRPTLSSTQDSNLFVGLSTEKANDLQGDHGLIVKNPDPEFNKGLISAEVSDGLNSDLTIDTKGDRDLIVEHPDPELDKGLMSANEKRDEKKECHKGMYSEELAFIEKVKEKLSNPENYQNFLKCLHIYAREIITREELQLLVDDLLGKYTDLMEEFNDFLTQSEKKNAKLVKALKGRQIFHECPNDAKFNDLL